MIEGEERETRGRIVGEDPCWVAEKQEKTPQDRKGSTRKGKGRFAYKRETHVQQFRQQREKKKGMPFQDQESEWKRQLQALILEIPWSYLSHRARRKGGFLTMR